MRATQNETYRTCFEETFHLDSVGEEDNVIRAKMTRSSTFVTGSTDQSIDPGMCSVLTVSTIRKIEDHC